MHYLSITAPRHTNQEGHISGPIEVKMLRTELMRNKPTPTTALFFFFNDPAPPEIYPLPLPAALRTAAAPAGLPDVHDTPVAGPITVPPSPAKLARSGTRRASGTPGGAADNLRPAAITRIGHATRSPRPGPFTTSVVLPALLPVRTPVAGSNVTRVVSPTLQ